MTNTLRPYKIIFNFGFIEKDDEKEYFTVYTHLLKLMPKVIKLFKSGVS